MTIKGLQKLIGKNADNLTLINCYGGGDMIVRQHLSVWGRAIYPMDGLPVMDEETLLAVLDVPREKWKDCQVLTADADSTLLTAMMEDNMDSDRPLEEMGIQLIRGGGEYKFLLDPLRDECYAIRPEYLKPHRTDQRAHVLAAGDRLGRQDRRGQARDRCQAWDAKRGRHRPEHRLGKRREDRGPAGPDLRQGPRHPAGAGAVCRGEKEE